MIRGRGLNEVRRTSVLDNVTITYMYRTNVIVVWDVGKADPIGPIALCLITKEWSPNDVHCLVQSEVKELDYNDVTSATKRLS